VRVSLLRKGFTPPTFSHGRGIKPSAFSLPKRTPDRYNAPFGTHVLVFDDDGLTPNGTLPPVIRQGAC
jgi:hypothetical protein